jgi:type VI secretion system protein ImpJ
MAMKRLQPVIWMKGTFLSPQYLQTQDRFIESTLQFQMDSLSFAPWGFRLQIDQAALAAGYLSVSDAAGIFPDGLIFDIPDSDPPPTPKPLADAIEADEETADVYLAIPHFRDRGLNVTIAQSNADTRYVAEISMLRDENTGMNEKPVQVARKNFRLLVGGESQQHTSTLRVARVRKTPAGMFQLEPRFVPPLLDFASSDFLMAIARRLVEVLTAKSNVLSGTRRQKNLSLAEFGVADIANFWLLYTINSVLPVIQHLFETRHGHPERLYAVMLSLAGMLSTFSPTLQPKDLPKYEHDDLATCFHDLDEKIRFLLETVVPQNFVSLPLKLVQGQAFIYATALADDKYLKDTKMYLAASADINEADLIGKAPYLMKVCSANHIEHLVRMALPGVPMTHIMRPPSAIPVKLNYQYFSLSQSGPAWEAIQRARNLAAYVPGDFPKPQLELIILLPEAN